MPSPPTAHARPVQIRYFSPWLLGLGLLWLVIYLSCFEAPGPLLARQWPLLLVGVAGAVIGNITAIGGGLVFIPVLIFGYGMDPVSALKLTFVTQAVGMTSGAVGWLNRGEVPFRELGWSLPPLLLGCLVSTFWIQPSPELVKGLLGPITLSAGALILFTLHQQRGEPALPRRALLPLAVISLLAGVITGWIAIGAGEIVAACCMLIWHFHPNRALGLGVVLLAASSILLGLVHALWLGGVPWDFAIFTMLAVLWGGRLGPFLGQWISMQGAKKLFAVIAVLNGLVIVAQSLGWFSR